MRQRDETKICFTIPDQGDEADGEVNGWLILGRRGIDIGFNGYGTADTNPDSDDGTPIFVELYNGEVIVRVFGDINEEEPTNKASLSGAKESNRLDGGLDRP